MEISRKPRTIPASLTGCGLKRTYNSNGEYESALKKLKVRDNSDGLEIDQLTGDAEKSRVNVSELLVNSTSTVNLYDECKKKDSDPPSIKSIASK